MNNDMFSEVELTRHVVLCAKHSKNLWPLHQQILHRLLQNLLLEKACKEHGFYLSITAIKSIGQNKNKNYPSQVLIFPVSFTCRTFKPRRGCILQGIVKRVLWNGVFIKSGPLKIAFLSSLKMPGYNYVPAQTEDEKPYFQRDDLTKIGVGVVMRFEAISVRFQERQYHIKNDFYVLASVEGDALGPISLTGSDEPYM